MDWSDLGKWVLEFFEIFEIRIALILRVFREKRKITLSLPSSFDIESVLLRIDWSYP